MATPLADERKESVAIACVWRPMTCTRRQSAALDAFRRKCVERRLTSYERNG